MRTLDTTKHVASPCNVDLEDELKLRFLNFCVCVCFFVFAEK